MTGEAANQKTGSSGQKMEMMYQRAKTVLEQNGYSCLLKKRSDNGFVTDIREREKLVAEFMVEEEEVPETPGVPKINMLFYNPMRPQDYNLNVVLHKAVVDVYVDEIVEHSEKLLNKTAVII